MAMELLRSYNPPLILQASSSYFLQPQINCPSQHYCTFTSLKFKLGTFCLDFSANPVVHETPKKKRKPRPTFIDLVGDKWSIKHVSQRDKFPWQEKEGKWQTHNHDEDETEDEEEEDTDDDDDVTISNSYSNRSVSDPLNFVPLNAVILAPWTQGIKTHTDARGGDNVSGIASRLNKDVLDSAFTGSTVLEDKPKTLVKLSRDNKKASVVRGSNSGISSKKSLSLLRKEEELDTGNKLNGEITLEEKNQPGSFGIVDSGITSADLPWNQHERKLELNPGEGKKRSNTELAEKTVPEHQLGRLRNVASRMLERIKVGRAGITEEILSSIHDIWKVDEVVKLKFEEPHSLNMKRTHEILESRTGGLVIWRSGSSVVLYRGMAYKLPCVQSYNKQNQVDKNVWRPAKDTKVETTSNNSSTESLLPDPAKNVTKSSDEEVTDLSEINRLLDQLGPRYKDWRGSEPLPVDADLLPTLVPEYKPPMRLLPYGMRHGLRDREMTMFRNLARRTSPHFILGRNRELQGLAHAMVRLWEISAIAKIAVKHGVQNTRNERMAEELRKLTGGTLVSRNKDYIVFYRGNDFLPPVVSTTLRERRKLTHLHQDAEEQARRTASHSIEPSAKISKGPLVAGTLAETMAATSRWGNQPSSDDVVEMRRREAQEKQASLIKHLEDRLALAKGKFNKAVRALTKLQENLEPSELPTDLETLGAEERFLFRKIGLSMKPFLLLGKRGVYDGTIENMHLHWKFREVVKIIVRGKTLPQVKHFAVSLEAESGGVLVSVEKTTKGYEVILYRGKNYQSPKALRPANLLTKRQALARSIELQRHEALRHHIADLEKRMQSLKPKSKNLKVGKKTNAEKKLSTHDVVK